MRLSSQLIFGIAVIVLGVVLLVANVTDVNLGVVCWPTALILVGIWLMARPKFEKNFPNTHILLIGDHDQSGEWEVTNREHYCFVGDYDLDLLQASIPPGKTHLRFFGFVQEIDLLLPAGVEVSIFCGSFVSDTTIFGHKQESFLFPVENTSPGYATAERKIRIECYGFVNNLKARTVPAQA